MIFNFKNTNENEVHKITKSLNVRKTCKGIDIPTKIIKLNIDLFSSFICQHFNNCISTDEFSNELKHADVILVHTKKDRVIKLTIGQLVYFQTLKKSSEKAIYNQFYKYLNFYNIKIKAATY